jgi:ABC-type Mn2+/Zn2+ transport system ATPase subunit
MSGGTIDAIVTLRQVAVGYGRRVVLSGIDLEIRRGSFVGLLGSNGSGKTTLLKAIAGIHPVLSGSVTLSPPAVLGYVPQRDQLDPVFIFSAFEVALMGVCGRVGAGRRIPSAEREHVSECLRQTGAEAFAHQLFAELSGGQKQRVLIARALAARADFLILDEPTAGVDAAATQAIMDLLVKLNHDHKLTILMVNHDLPVMRRVQEVIWLKDGTITRGPAEELLSARNLEQLLQLQLA